MNEITLQLKTGSADTTLKIRGDTKEEARALAHAIAGLWKSATDAEKQCLISLVESGKPLDYRSVSEKEFRELCGRLKGANLFARMDKKGMYHVVMRREDKEQSHEASAVRLLRKKQIAKEVEKRHGKKPQEAKDEKPSDEEQKVSMLFMVRRELAPMLERIEKLEDEFKKMMEEK